ncbi:TPA: cobalamin biosynthesis protein [Candidatus Bathyarchaeota archaeon]|nr:cobalamin biosynthesis protein [Candidatus Bathyarchaeota archaeon]
MERIAVVGRGGTGKTSFTALLASHFIEKGETPILLVDLDPDMNLAEMVGVDLEAAGKSTVSELLLDTMERESDGTDRPQPFPLEKLEARIWGEGLYEGEGFDLLTLGVKWGEGCYCTPNKAMRMALEGMMRSYRHVIIDSPAGLEQLNRRVTPEVDDIFDIIDPSNKAFDHVRRSRRLLDELNLACGRFFVVGNYRFPEGWEAEVEAKTGETYLGKLASDEALADAVLQGESLLKLPRGSASRVSAEAIFLRAGY